MTPHARIVSPRLVGREAEQRRLADLLVAARSGAPAVAVVTGEAGIGKTRLVREFSARARENGALVLSGTCIDVGEGTLPYAPIIQALRGLPDLLEPAELASVLDSGASELARLVPGLGAATSSNVDTAPSRLFEVLLALVQRLAAWRTVVLVAEDVHWADRSTLDLLLFLAQNLRGACVVVVTYRDDEVDIGHPARRFVARLRQLPSSNTLGVGRLGRGDCATLVAAILGGVPDPDLLRNVWDRSEGNPFFIEELLASANAGLEVPGLLREVLLARISTLSRQAQRVLQVAAVAGRSVDHHLLAAVTKMAPDRLVALVQQAITRHLLTVQENGGYSFRHALIPEAIYSAMLPVERAQLHGQYADAWDARTRTGNPGAVELGHLAYHRLRAGDREQALPACLRAAQAARHSFAYAEALTHFEQVVTLCSQHPEGAAPDQIDITQVHQWAAEAASVCGQPRTAVTHTEQAIAAVAGDQAATGRLLVLRARYEWELGQAPTAMVTLEQAMSLVPAVPVNVVRAQAEAAYARLLLLDERLAAAITRAAIALRMARHLADHSIESLALSTLGSAQTNSGHIDAGLQNLRDALQLSEQFGSGYEIARAYTNLAASLWGIGRCDEAAEVALRGFQEARRLGSAPTNGAMLLANASAALLRAGRWPEARRCLDEAAEIASPGMVGWTYHVMQRGLYHLWRGDIAAARADMTVLLSRYPQLEPRIAGPVHTQLAETFLWDGNIDQARSTVERGLQMVAHAEDAQHLLPLCRIGLAVEAAAAQRASIAHLPSELDHVRRRAQDLLERARQAASGGSQTPPNLAELATAVAEHSAVAHPSGDVGLWAAAVAAWDHAGFPYPAAYARWRLSEALIAGGKRDQARATLHTTRHAAATLGAHRLVVEIEALAQRARLRISDDSTATAGSPGQLDTTGLGLTPREIEVLALLAIGLTNAQIAQRLFISPKTAGVHVSKILAKLGAANRTEAANIAGRLGLLGLHDAT
jgi:DNA-binding CsgD family transcriptional regulator/tetratricopeptide (TPR) repeat protein